MDGGIADVPCQSTEAEGRRRVAEQLNDSRDQFSMVNPAAPSATRDGTPREAPVDDLDRAKLDQPWLGPGSNRSNQKSVRQVKTRVDEVCTRWPILGLDEPTMNRRVNVDDRARRCVPTHVGNLRYLAAAVKQTCGAIDHLNNTLDATSISAGTRQDDPRSVDNERLAPCRPAVAKAVPAHDREPVARPHLAVLAPQGHIARWCARHWPVTARATTRLVPVQSSSQNSCSGSNRFSTTILQAT
jgi:hypothetical protein